MTHAPSTKDQAHSIGSRLQVSEAQHSRHVVQCFVLASIAHVGCVLWQSYILAVQSARTIVWVKNFLGLASQEPCF